jgi:hypothetical protein
MPRPQSVFVGDVFGRLTVKARLLNREAACVCTCGNVHVVNESHLSQGRSQSCGCLHKEVASASRRLHGTTHGKFGTRIYAIWNGMVGRCHNPSNSAYENYGARGIFVCKEWRQFENFYADMGDPPKGLTLDRRDNSLGYSKANCRWATSSEQANNKRSNVLLTYAGRTQNATQWAYELGISRSVIYERKELGWSDEQCLITPVRKKRK